MPIAAPAVQQGQTGSYVYVISPDGKAEVRPVTVAQISEGQALIDSGLKANETVVIDGRDVVRDGVHLLAPDVPAELSRAIRAVLA